MPRYGAPSLHLLLPMMPKGSKTGTIHMNSHGKSRYHSLFCPPNAHTAQMVEITKIPLGVSINFR